MGSDQTLWNDRSLHLIREGADRLVLRVCLLVRRRDDDRLKLAVDILAFTIANRDCCWTKLPVETNSLVVVCIGPWFCTHQHVSSLFQTSCAGSYALECRPLLFESPVLLTRSLQS